MTPQKRWKNRHPKKQRAIQARCNTRRHQLFRETLDEAKSKPCADCGKRYPTYVMHLDHVRGRKLFNPSQARQQGRGIAALRREIKKCDVVCANCHAERTWGPR